MLERRDFPKEEPKNYLPEVSARRKSGYLSAWGKATEGLQPETVVHQILKEEIGTADQDQFCILLLDSKMRVLREHFYTPGKFRYALSKPDRFLREMILHSPRVLIAVHISGRDVPMSKERMSLLKFASREYYRERKKYDDATLKAADRAADRLGFLCRLSDVGFADFILTDYQMDGMYSFLQQGKMEGKKPSLMEGVLPYLHLTGFAREDAEKRKALVRKSENLKDAPVKLAWDHYEYTEEAISSPEAAIRLIRELLQDSDRERIGVINMRGNQPINFSIAAVGRTDYVAVDSKLLLKTTVLSGADAVILFHNHPSGSLDPSVGDYEVTKQMDQLCSLCSITLADHVIIGYDNEYCYSFYKGGEFHALRESPYVSDREAIRTEMEALPFMETGSGRKMSPEMDKNEKIAAEPGTPAKPVEFRKEEKVEESGTLTKLEFECRLWTEPEDRYAVYQISDDGIGRDGTYMFMSLESVRNHGMEVRGMDYDLAYSGPLMPGQSLESIYVEFNLYRPEDFKGHSMSVSDVVIMKRGMECKAYYVDSIGFAELPDFVQERKEIAFAHRRNMASKSVKGEQQAQDGQSRMQKPMRRGR